MRQTTLSATFDVKSESFERLIALLEELHDRRQKTAGGYGPYADFLGGVPMLHFLSLSLFPGFDYDPLFVIEANFDGAPEQFWPLLEAAIGKELREALRCCKPPLDDRKVLFEKVTEAESTAPLTPYFKACTLKPSAFHNGNRGLPRYRIEQESDLFRAIRNEIDQHEADYRKKTPPQIHQALRAALAPKYDWLTKPAEPRIDIVESATDVVKLFLFLSLVVFVLSAPGLILGLTPVPYAVQYLLQLVIALLLAWKLSAMIDTPKTNKPSAPFSAPWGLIIIGAAAFFFLYWQFASYVAGFVYSVLASLPWEKTHAAALGWIKVSLPSVFVSGLGAIVWIRWLERRDSTQDKPPVDPNFLSEMAKREDWTPQNHMGSIVHIKPGVMRTIVVRAGHLGLHLVLRLIARDGYLGSMRTIHFAHWAFVNNTSRLMFFSNFDQTWESYLDDFIEKAHGGLTLAWSCGVGFPPARFLVMDGASAGKQFKEWARHSMAVSRFWYSAYKDLTTEQIERNYRLALALRKPYLGAQEAVEWLKDL